MSPAARVVVHPAVLVVVHDVAPRFRRPVLGSLLPAMLRRGFTVDILEARELDGIDLAGTDLVCVTGSPDSVYDSSLDWVAPEREFLQRVDAAGIPVLGVCFGAQILADALGGSVAPSSGPEHGFTLVETTRPELIAPGPWMESHHDTITAPPTAEVIARTEHNVQAFTVGAHLGVQFHPEITPECFLAWREGFDRHGRDNSYDSEVDVPAMTAEIESRATAAAADCDELFERFLRHAGLGSDHRSFAP
ncbi:hypothetical protein GCM10027169_11030 [Gordonia jinhuaensis]|uniref:Glutamine amidotransferase domain-containing protein n=1 Tax=Gordonia jinhuaensis TaxID=1517702 RepID=A0A916SWE0_9ACTN|nr:type 1 glutamine amidotransferase [Gordonia jinhuaensis]GGB19991.1 hypothetical protein GCM10011489_05190 [Gordonia jinhuaensis]